VNRAAHQPLVEQPLAVEAVALRLAEEAQYAREQQQKVKKKKKKKKKKPTPSARFASLKELTVVLSIAAMWSASNACRSPSV
jgi:predicted transcriptional regulator